MDIEKITVLQKVDKFFKEIKGEWNKITWTGRKEVMSGTIAVLILSAIISIFLTLIDTGLSFVVKKLLGAG